MKHRRILESLILGGMVLGIFFGVIGALLVYQGSAAESSLRIFGQELKTGNVGIIAVFLGAAIVLFTIKSGFSHLSAESKPESETAVDPEAEPPEAKVRPTVSQPTDSPAAELGHFDNPKSLQITTTARFEDDLRELGHTRDEVIGAIWNEFQNHTNYFIFDLEDYPLPIRGNRIVLLNKAGDKVDLCRLVPATADQAKRAKWEDLLTLYRRLTRLPYRENPSWILLRESHLRQTLSLHEELRRRMERYFEDFIQLGTIRADIVHPLEELIELKGADEDLREMLQEPEDPEDRARRRDVISRLRAARAAQNEARACGAEAAEAASIPPQALGVIVSAVERSLQYYHKLLLDYAPTAEGRSV